MTMAAHNLSQRFPGRRALVTGAASGLGLACAEILAREGWRLVLTDVDAPRLDLVAQSLARDGAPSAAVACDVRDEAAIRALVDQAVAAFGGLDVAIHSAGVATAGAFHTSTAEDWRWVFDINVHGLANCCRAVLPHMSRGAGGLVINVASAASFCTNAKMSSYNAAKAAVVALSETLMQEYAPTACRPWSRCPASSARACSNRRAARSVRSRARAASCTTRTSRRPRWPRRCSAPRRAGAHILCTPRATRACGASSG